jgi:hypothetical protein
MKCSVDLRNELDDLLDEYQRKRLKIEVKIFQAAPAKRPALEATLTAFKQQQDSMLGAKHKHWHDTYNQENGLEDLS